MPDESTSEAGSNENLKLCDILRASEVCRQQAIWNKKVAACLKQIAVHLDITYSPESDPTLTPPWN
jgi:hypothetical protein